MTEAERRLALERIADDVRACTRCRLHEGRTHAVPGEGHPSTEVLFVGEAPGLNEDRQGRPFVGAAGGFLTELLETVGWSRDEVYITNVVKCRPPQNRDPEPDEIAACAPFLRRQLEILDPALVVTLGRHSMGRFMPGARIGQAHGTIAPAPDSTGARDTKVFAMYHPAAALHQASLRQTLLDDMAGVPEALIEARRGRESTRARRDGGGFEQASSRGVVPAPDATAGDGEAPVGEIAIVAPDLAPDLAPVLAPDLGPDLAPPLDREALEPLSSGGGLALDDLVPVGAAESAGPAGPDGDAGVPSDQMTLF